MDEVSWQDYYQDQEDYPHYCNVILLLHEEGRKGNADVEGTCPLRISVFLTFLFRLIVGKTLVSLGNHYEASISVGVIGVTIWVIYQCETTVCLFDLFVCRIWFNLKYFIRVESFKLVFRVMDDFKTYDDGINECCEKCYLHK